MTTKRRAVADVPPLRTPRRRWSPCAVVAAAVILTAGCGDDAGSPPERAYAVELHIDDSADDYEYVPDRPFDIKVGDRVTFRITNTGRLPHDVQIVDPEGRQIATGPIADPGGVTEAVVLFEQAGIYQINCLVGDHLTGHRMQALVRAETPTS